MILACAPWEWFLYGLASLAACVVGVSFGIAIARAIRDARPPA